MHSGRRRLGTATCPRPRPLLLLLLCWLMGLSEDGPFIVTVFHSQGLSSLFCGLVVLMWGVNPDSGVARNPLFGHFMDTSLYTITHSLSLYQSSQGRLNQHVNRQNIIRKDG